MNPLIHKIEQQIAKEIELKKMKLTASAVDEKKQADKKKKGKKGKAQKGSRDAGEYDIELFRPGDTVKVYYKIVEEDKERLQIFQGTVIARKHGGIRETFTVRRIVAGEGVERIFPLYSPKLMRVEVVRRGRVRRAKLYYLRDRVGKATRVRELLGAPVQKIKRWEKERRERIAVERKAEIERLKKEQEKAPAAAEQNAEA